jgi:hypothetical protein
MEKENEFSGKIPIDPMNDEHMLLVNKPSR